MKKLTLIFIVLCIVLNVKAYDFEINGVCYTIKSTSEPYTVAVSSYNSPKYIHDLTIPSSVTNNGKNYSVTSIDYRAFYMCYLLRSISLPSTITSIENNAFSMCNSLSRINIPNSVKSIGSWAFGNCSDLKEITIPNSVKSIGGAAFNKSGITRITIPQSVIELGGGAFNDCPNLKNIRVENKTPLKIDAYSFSEKLTSTCILEVPSGSKGEYLAAEGWKAFSQIIEFK